MEIAYLPAGTTSIYDLRQKRIAESISPIYHIDFYMPRMAINRIAEEEGFSVIDDLDHNPGKGVVDPVLEGVAGALRESFDHPHAACSVFADHVTINVTFSCSDPVSPNLNGH